MMLSLHGPEVYDGWTDHELPFDSPEVTEAVESVTAIWFSVRPEVAHLMEYVTSAEYADQRIENSTGSFLTPHLGQKTERYERAVDQETAEILTRAETVRFDASGLMPPQIDSGLLWTEATRYIEDETDTATFLEEIENQ